MNSPFVLDASALLCLIRDEPGAAVVAALLPDSTMSAVNLSETVAKLADVGMDAKAIGAVLAPLQLRVVAFGETAALTAGLLRVETRAAGLSFGDRACLALAQELGAQAVTTDRAWSRLESEVAIRLVR
ncbi:MAG: type II toxin-antitoxin system VapC family toxin [Caulobacteraceae bacterium]